MERGEFLTIRQARDEIVLDYGASRRSFTPGGRSVVSAENGVARPNLGLERPPVRDRDQGADGSTRSRDSTRWPPTAQRLMETLHIGTATSCRRRAEPVYDHADASPAAAQPPTEGRARKR